MDAESSWEKPSFRLCLLGGWNFTVGQMGFWHLSYLPLSVVMNTMNKSALSGEGLSHLTGGKPKKEFTAGLGKQKPQKSSAHQGWLPWLTQRPLLSAQDHTDSTAHSGLGLLTPIINQDLPTDQADGVKSSVKGPSSQLGQVDNPCLC